MDSAVWTLPRSHLVITVLFTLPVGPSLHAQDVVRIDGERTCCTIAADPVVLLGDEEQGIVGPNFVIERDSLGRYLVAFAGNPARIQVFDSDGAHLQTVGRRGQGPGEYISVSALAMIDGRLHVFDSPARRRTVLDSAFTVLRTARIPGQPISLAAFARDTLVVNTSIRTRDLAGYPLHVLAPDGEVVRSMGYVEGYRVDFRTSDMRQLARAADDEFWAAHTTEYVIERWGLDGARRAVIELVTDWFDGYTGNCCTFDPEVPPKPRLKSIEVDSNGWVWVISSVSDPEWHEALVDGETGPGSFWVDDWNGFYDSVVDVIDPGSNELIASGRFDEYFTRWIEPGLTASNVLVGGVSPRIRVWRLRVLHPNRRQP